MAEHVEPASGPRVHSRQEGHVEGDTSLTIENLGQRILSVHKSSDYGSVIDHQVIKHGMEALPMQGSSERRRSDSSQAKLSPAVRDGYDDRLNLAGHEDDREVGSGQPAGCCKLWALLCVSA